jgi:hypothetical protein
VRSVHAGAETPRYAIVYMYVHSYMRARTHTHTHMYICYICVHTTIHTYIHTYMHTLCTPSSVGLLRKTLPTNSSHTYMPTYIHTYVLHTYVRTYIHTYIHTFHAVHHLPLDYYERHYQRIAVLWATVTFALIVGGEALRDATRASGQAFSRVLYTVRV